MCRTIAQAPGSKASIIVCTCYVWSQRVLFPSSVNDKICDLLGINACMDTFIGRANAAPVKRTSATPAGSAGTLESKTGES